MKALLKSKYELLHFSAIILLSGCNNSSLPMTSSKQNSTQASAGQKSRPTVATSDGIQSLNPPHPAPTRQKIKPDTATSGDPLNPLQIEIQKAVCQFFTDEIMPPLNKNIQLGFDQQALDLAQAESRLNSNIEERAEEAKEDGDFFLEEIAKFKTQNNKMATDLEELTRKKIEPLHDQVKTLQSYLNFNASSSTSQEVKVPANSYVLDYASRTREMMSQQPKPVDVTRVSISGERKKERESQLARKMAELQEKNP